MSEEADKQKRGEDFIKCFEFVTDRKLSATFVYDNVTFTLSELRRLIEYVERQDAALFDINYQCNQIKESLNRVGR